MFRKLILFLCLFFAAIPSYSSDLGEVETFFESYVNAANSYSKDVVNYYLNDAKIIRVVLKKDGTTQAVSFPMERYRDELIKGQKFAKVAKYKNTYVNRNFEKLEDGNYKITASRIPNRDKTGLPFYFIVTKTDDGWKIKEESMETTVQKFLTSK